METKKLTERLSVSPQILADDMAELKAQGFRAIICNRPDGEGTDQPTFTEIETAAKKHGLEAVYIPVVSGKVVDTEADAFGAAMETLPAPVLAYCRSGMRSATLWSLSQAGKTDLADILSTTKAAGYDMSGVVRRIANGGKTPTDTGDVTYEVVIVGAGAGGIATAASLKARKPDLEIAIIDPADVHYYQPGWTMVGGGVFDASETAKTMASLIPQDVHWIKAAVAAFEPKNNAIILDGCRVVKYKRLVVCPGLKLDWGKIEGLNETLGQNGVTSNYRYDLAPYTWELVSTMTSGRAIFTQPPMPIKCAGAPQKAMYLSGDAWHRRGVLKDIDIQFNNAGGVVERIEMDFDMMHVCPPQSAPDFIRVSPLADAAGWVNVDQATLRHKSFDNIWALGDVMNAPNAKTMAAARKQAPVVANNMVADMNGKSATSQYDGYGSCPLTVERGKIVLAEFGYGGVLLPSFPRALIDGTKPSRAAWFLKEHLLPPIYWQGMLKGREWLAKPEALSAKVD